MWLPLKTEVIDRFAAVEDFYKATRGLGGKVEQTGKGLAFVHVYAAYEFTVKNVMRTAIDAIIAHQHKVKDMVPSLMTLFLDPQLTSLRECDNIKVWSKRIVLFERLCSKTPATVPNTTFPRGDHFRSTHLQMVFDVLGIKRSPAYRTRHLVRINEVVDNRNAVAHGGDTADSVGQRYTRTEILEIIRQVKSVCLLVVNAAEKHCSKKAAHCRTP